MTITEREAVKRSVLVQRERQLCHICGGIPLRRRLTYGDEWLTCPRCKITWSSMDQQKRQGARFYLREIKVT